MRDNIHSYDLVQAFDHFVRNPRCGEVYNIGGGRANSCSIHEAIALCEKISGQKMKYTYSENNRSGDHVWYISSLKKFQEHYPAWHKKYDLSQTLQQIYEAIT